YTAASTTYGFVDISATGTQILVASDDDTLTVDMGMNFNFYGQTYSQTCIGANGLMAFNGCEPGKPPVNFTNTPTFNDDPVIAPLNDDWQFFNTADGATPDAVYYQTIGSQFIVEWNQAYGYPSSPSSVTFEAILTQGSNQILFEYLNVDSGDSRALGGSAVVGIRNMGGDQNGNALVWSFNGSTPIANLSAIEFDAPEAAAPEPSTIWGCGLGLVLMAALYVRRRANNIGG
ncbi:MAG TPA: PEP-CTERM sorting domain-containing protein, partial [Bryobacteraceae bacterium]